MQRAPTSWAMRPCEKCGDESRRPPSWNLCSRCFYQTNNIEVSAHPCNTCGKQEVRPAHFQLCRKCFQNKSSSAAAEPAIAVDENPSPPPLSTPSRLWLVQLLRQRVDNESKWQGIAMASTKEEATALLLTDYSAGFKDDTPLQLMETRNLIYQNLLSCNARSFVQLLQVQSKS